MTTAQLLHFVVRNVTYAITDTGVTVTCYTNNPCHLWLRWTNIIPQKHVNPVIVRGAPVGTYINQCFVVYHDVEQNELGDTFTHTFTLEPWPSCETRWFYFWGTVGGQLSPSASAIFSYHRLWTAPTLYCTNAPPDPNLRNNPGGCDKMAYAIKPCASFTPTEVSFWLQSWPPAQFWPTAQAQIYTSDLVGRPLVKIGESPITLLAPAPPSPTKYTFQLNCAPLVANNTYSVCFWLNIIYLPDVYYWGRIIMTNALDTCPHPAPPTQRLWIMDCVPILGWGCDCTAKPWFIFISQPMTYELKGQPL